MINYNNNNNNNDYKLFRDTPPIPEVPKPRPTGGPVVIISDYL